MLAIPLSLFALPACAQQMQMPMPSPTPAQKPDGPHAGHKMAMSQQDGGHADPMAGMAMTTKPAAQEAARAVETPPPAAAGSGPARAADAIWGADAMAASRRQLRVENGGQSFASLLVDRAEYRAKAGHDGYVWDAQGWYGGDIDRLVVKSEGEGNFGGSAEQAEVQALWGHAIGPWFDVQGGVRHDFAGAKRTDAVIAVQGLAPYEFEVGASAFLSTHGELRARFEGELDQRITQRLIVQPRTEINLSSSDIHESSVGAGLSSIEAGVRLRYEISRQFAPYIGVAQEWRTGRSARFARADGESPSATSFVAGVRFWF